MPSPFCWFLFILYFFSFYRSFFCECSKFPWAMEHLSLNLRFRLIIKERIKDAKFLVDRPIRQEFPTDKMCASQDISLQLHEYTQVYINTHTKKQIHMSRAKYLTFNRLCWPNKKQYHKLLFLFFYSGLPEPKYSDLFSWPCLVSHTWKKKFCFRSHSNSMPTGLPRLSSVHQLPSSPNNKL